MKPCIIILIENYNYVEFLNFEEPFNNHLKASLLFKSTSSALLCFSSFIEVMEVNYEPFPPSVHAFEMSRTNKESIKFKSNITNEFYA